MPPESHTVTVPELSLSLSFVSPDATLDYAFDWSTHWLQDDETIDSYTVTVSSGLTKDNDSESSGTVTVWLSGGTAGETYEVACKIVTSLGRTDERTIEIIVRER